MLESIEHIASRRGIKTEMGKVEIEERPPKQNEISGLECDPSDHVLSVARTILIDKKPVAYLWDVILTRIPRAGMNLEKCSTVRSWTYS